MSGGYFEYSLYKINDIADELEEIIEKNGKPIPWGELDYYDRLDYEGRLDYEQAPMRYSDYPPGIIERFKEGLKVLRRAYIYAQRIDWLLSGDDGESSFLRRLKDDIDKLKRREDAGTI